MNNEGVFVTTRVQRGYGKIMKTITSKHDTPNNEVRGKEQG